MSHVSRPSAADSSESDSEWDGPGASKGELLKTLKMLQVQMQKLQEENRTIKEENKTLNAEKPKRKWCMNAHDELSVHEETISIYACKYGMMIEMFSSSDLLNKRLPDSPTPFDSTDRYATASTQESAFLDELYRHFPESLHKVMESSYFSDLVMKSIPDAHANEIKKLQGVAGDIFDLPSKYFTNTSYDRANVPEIQRLLGVTSSTNLAYKTFPLVLFPELKEDRSLKLSSETGFCWHKTSSDSESFVAWYHIPPSHFQWQRRTYQLHEMEHLASHAGLHHLGHSSSTNNSTAADLEDAAAAIPQADEVGAAVISSSGEVLQEAADDLSSTRGRSKKSKRGRKVTTPAMATNRTIWQAHK
ncbi:uncharacterized protein EDB93DRAFT_1099331 [Suillus bovinus]|uniref:uncharacterized protein n=1 Tax=Suillus bovinus TaxID=48563 RepID=UPI001B86AA98|nr:uncharacterized protein EDB93DRAFT_1099331 [Suillus bovinus]KAG2159903.1 hypothetical protein EDB93DRAFT_1099331 [Suillus bovinus]